MQTLQFNKNSWHAWLVETFTSRYLNEIKNFCQYIRLVVLAVFMAFVVAIVTSYLAATLVSAITWDIAYFTHHVHYFIKGNAHDHPWQTLAETGNCIWGLILVFMFVVNLRPIVRFFIGLTIKGLKKVLPGPTLAELQAQPIKEPSFIMNALRTFKDKVCFKVSFK